MAAPQSKAVHVDYDTAISACPNCDLLHKNVQATDTRLNCAQCGYPLALGRGEAITRVVGLALTCCILMIVVVTGPFLNLSAGPFGSSASVLDVVMGFRSGLMIPLALSVLLFIIVLPLSRAVLLLYALTPLVMGWKNRPGAATALRWAFQLKPWAMAEIFMVGVAVALVKLAGMATVNMGPAFWAFALFVIVNAFQDTNMCRQTLWQAIAANGRTKDVDAGLAQET
ncbi:MAG: paraquat-inducible protein A [Pseudomonadota bacterium]